MGIWNSETRALARRLLIAAVVVALIVVGAVAMRRFGVWIPWWVPALAFAVIVVAAIARARELGELDDEEDADVAGRIGPDPDDVQ